MFARIGIHSVAILAVLCSRTDTGAAQDLYEAGRSLRVTQVTELAASGTRTFHSTWVRGVVVRVVADSVLLRRGAQAEPRTYLLNPASRVQPIPASPNDPVGRPLRLRFLPGPPEENSDSPPSSFTGVLAGIGIHELWVVDEGGSLPFPVSRSSVASAEVRWEDPAMRGLIRGAIVGAGLGLFVALLSGEFLVPVAGAALGAPIGLTFGAAGGGGWQPFLPSS